MSIEKISSIERVIAKADIKQLESLSPSLLVGSFLQSLEKTLSSYLKVDSDIVPLSKIDIGAILEKFRSLLLRDGIDPETLIERVDTLRSLITDTKESWRPFIQETIKARVYPIYEEIFSQLEGLRLVPGGFGAGACYYLVDKKGEPQFVVKPIDEDIFCMNNRKGFTSFRYPDEAESSLRAVPRYHSHQIDMMASDLAILLGLEEVTPQTVMWIHKDQEGAFFDIRTYPINRKQLNSSSFPLGACRNKRAILINITLLFLQAPSDKIISNAALPINGIGSTDGISGGEECLGKKEVEKLCSLQRYIKEARELFSVRQELIQQGIRGEELAYFFDQRDLEEASLFMMVSGDSDGHGGNILAYIKRFDDQGRAIYGVKKIDNGLSFPTENGYAMNSLLFYPNAKLPFSQEMSQKALAINENRIALRMEELGLPLESIEAMKERVSALKKGVLEGCCMAEIGQRIRSL